MPESRRSGHNADMDRSSGITGRDGAGRGQSSGVRKELLDVAYVVSRFPKVTETFVIDEVVELQRQGVTIDVWALVGSSEGVVQPAAALLVERATCAPRSLGVLARAQIRWLLRRPTVVVVLWLRTLVLNRSSVAELVRSLLTTAAAFAWAAELSNRPPRRLHAHWATHPALAVYVMAHLLDVPYGFTAHAHDVYGENGMLEEKLRAADLVVTISDFNDQLLRARFPTAASKVRVLHCGIDPCDFAAVPRLGSGPVLELLCVASLTDYKGHRHLLDAIAALRDRGVVVRCRLVGDGPEGVSLRRQAGRLELGEVLAFEGRLPAPEVRRLLEACDVFVLPSIILPSGVMEGIPVALMEALAVGRPVVVSRLSGIPELIQEGVTGLLVPPGDSQALAEALEKLAVDPRLREQFGAAGPPRVRDGFDRPTNVAQLKRWLTAPARGPVRVSLLSSVS